MSRIRRVVLDTSTLVSAALRPDSIPYQALLKALGSCELCAGTNTLTELERVLSRKKFDRYLDRESRQVFVALIRRSAHVFVVEDAELAAAKRRGHDACRDAGDVIFLALALAAEADAMVSGDEDLLVLHPWRGIPIITAAEFLHPGT